MSSEIDRLEIVIESEASKANRGLTALEKRISKVADSLDKLVGKTGGIGNLGDLGLGDISKASAKIDDLQKRTKSLGAKPTKMNVDTKDIKKATKEATNFSEMFKNVGKNLKFDGNLFDVNKEIVKTEKALDRLADREEKFNLAGGNKNGQRYRDLQYDIAKALNYLNNLYDTQKKLQQAESNRIANLPIQRMSEYKSSDEQKQPREVELSQPVTYNEDAMRMTFGDGAAHIRNATDLMREFQQEVQQAGLSLNNLESNFNPQPIVTYEGQIRSLKEEMANLGMQGVGQGDAEFDALALKLQEVILKKKEYDAATRAAAQTGAKFSTTAGQVASKIKEVALAAGRAAGSGLKKLGGLMGSLGQKVKKVLPSMNKSKSAMTGMNGIAKKLSKSIFRLGNTFKIMLTRMAMRAVINGVKEGFQNLAIYSNEANANISTLMSGLTQLKNSFAAAFAPILNVVTPILATLINYLVAASTKIGEFFAALTGQKTYVVATKVQEDYAAGLADNAGNAKAATDANKKLQRTLMGFDQINKLDDNSDKDKAGGGSGAGGSGISPHDMYDTANVTKGMKDFTDKIKEAWKNADFTEIGTMIGAKLNSALANIPWDKIKETANKVAKSIATLLNGFIKETEWGVVGNTLAQAINTVFGFVKTFADEFEWEEFGNAVATGINGALSGLEWDTIKSAVSGIAKGIAKSLNEIIKETEWGVVGKTLGEAINTIIGFGYTIVTTFEWSEFGQALADGVNSAFETMDLAKLGTTIGLFIDGVITTIATFIEETEWKMIGGKINALFTNVFNNIDLDSPLKKMIAAIFGGALVAGIAMKLAPVIKVIGSIGSAFSSVASLAGPAWATIKVAVVTACTAIGVPVGVVVAAIAAVVLAIADLWKTSESFRDTVGTVWGDIKKSFVGAVNNVKNSIAPLGAKIKELGTNLYDLYEKSGIKKIVEILAKMAVQLAGGHISAGIKMISKAFQGLAKILGAVVTGISGHIKIITGLLTLDGEKIKSGFKDIGKDMMNGINEGIKTIGSGLWESVKTVFTSFVASIKTYFGIKSPSTLFAEIGGFLMSGLLGGLKDKITGVVTWMKELPGKVVAAVGNAKTWLTQKGKDAIEGLKGGWDKVKESSLGKEVAKISGYVKDKVGNISDKVKEKGKDIINGIKSGYDAVKQNGLLNTVAKLKDNVTTSIGAMKDNVLQKGKDIIAGVKNGYDNNKNTLTKAVSGLPNTVTKAIGSLYNAGKGVMQTFANGFNSIKLKLPRISTEWTKHTVGALSFSVPKFSLSWYAKGGFPNAGEMFIANEAGPEMVGKMGNKNVVANNNQITNGIKNAVVEGMMQVMMTGGDNAMSGQAPVIENIIMVDTETLYRATQEGKRKSDGRYHVVVPI